MKLVSYNIQYGFGADGRYDLARAIGAVADADIIALQEVERFWKRSNEDDQPELIAGCCPIITGSTGRPSTWMPAIARPDGRIVNRRRQFGTMLLSRLPIAWSRLHLLPMRRTVDAAEHAERGARMPDPHALRADPVLFHPPRPYRRRGAAGGDRLSCSNGIACAPKSRAALERHRRRARALLDEWRGRAGMPARRDLDGRFQQRAWQRRIQAHRRQTTPIILIRRILPAFADAAIARRPAAARPPHACQADSTARRFDAGSTIASSARCWPAA